VRALGARSSAAAAVPQWQAAAPRRQAQQGTRSLAFSANDSG
jgi:hypothetical protein